MKDPAVLFFISDWLTATAEMDADVKGWYLDLILHNYDKGSLPNDVEILAKLAGVKFSEYDRFKQMFEQVIKHKFEQIEDNRLTNHRTSHVLQSREMFKDKRSHAGKTSYLMKYFAKNFPKEYANQDIKRYVKQEFDYSIDLTNEHMLKQMFKQMFELYINGYGNENRIDNEVITIEPKKNKLKKPTESEFLEYGSEQLVSLGKDPDNFQIALKSKFKSWEESGWINGKTNKPIENWKSTLVNTIPYMLPLEQKETKQEQNRSEFHRLCNLNIEN